MTSTWTPPILLQPDHSADAPVVLAAIERLRPDYVVVAGDPFASCLAGLRSGPCLRCGLGDDQVPDMTTCAFDRHDFGPRLIVCEPDPALRAVWEAARAGQLVEATGDAIRRWVEVTAAAMRHYTAGNSWRFLTHTEPAKGQPISTAASWALAAAAGCRDGVWTRDASGRLASPYHENGDPAGVERRLFPVVDFEEPTPAIGSRDRAMFEVYVRACGGGWRPRAEAAQAFAQRHLAAVHDNWLTSTRAALALRRDGLSVLLVVGGPVVEEEPGQLVRVALKLVSEGAALIAWCSGAEIDAWAPLTHGTELRFWSTAPDKWLALDPRVHLPDWFDLTIGGQQKRHMDRRANGVTWTRDDTGAWHGTAP